MEQYLVEEIALDGGHGVTVQRLSSFIADFHDKRAADEGSPRQLVDDAFVDYAWKRFITLRPELRIGYLKETVAADSPFRDDLDKVNLPRGKDKPKSLKGKGRTTLLGSGRRKDENYELIDLPPGERLLPRAELSHTYGDTLRLAASDKDCVFALLGSHDRPNRLTTFVFGILESIARSREDGITMVELGQEFVHDQKSLFHFTKTLLELNLIVKLRSNYFDPVKNGNIHTSRLIHRRFVATSPHCRVSEEAAAAEREAAALIDAHDAEEGTDTSSWRPLTKEHFFTSDNVVINRIKYVLRSAPGQMMPHTDIIHAIKISDIDVQQRKKLNRLIDRLMREGVVEKVAAITEGKEKVSIACIRLVESVARDFGHEEVDSVENVGSINGRADVSIEWQMLEMLSVAGSKGLTLKQIGRSLSMIDVRGIEAILARIEQTPPPAHLADLTIRSVTETIGRTKQTRFFSTQGYRERCQMDGIDVPDGGFPIQNPELVGGFALLPGTGFYRSIDDLSRAFSVMAPGRMRGSGIGRLESPSNTSFAPLRLSAPAIPLPGSPKSNVAGSPSVRSRLPPEALPKKGTRPKKPALLDENGNVIVRKRGRPRKEPGAPVVKRMPKTTDVDSTRSHPAQVASQPSAGDHDSEPLLKRPRHSTSIADDVVDGPHTAAEISNRSPGFDGRETSERATHPFAASDLQHLLPLKRKRGRPRKYPRPEESEEPPLKKARGRPRKSAVRLEDASPKPGDANSPSPPNAVLTASGDIPVPTDVQERQESDPSPAAQRSLVGRDVPMPPGGTQAAVIGTASNNIRGADEHTQARSDGPDGGLLPLSTLANDTSNRSTLFLKSDFPKGRKLPNMQSIGRGPKPGRIPHTQAVRESEIMALIKRKGGIVVDWHPFRLEHLEFVKEIKGADYATVPIDKLSMDRIVRSMISRNIVRRTAVTLPGFAGGQIRHNILYLPDIEFDGEQMKDFLASLQQRNLAPEIHQAGRQKMDVSLRRHVPLRRGGRSEPGREATDDDIRAFFSQQWRIVAQWYNYCYGRLARGRCLHEWVAGYVLDHPDLPFNAVSCDVIFSEMPLNTYMRIVPTTHMYEELDVFLETVEGPTTLLRDLPEDIRQILLIGKTKSRERMLSSLTLLTGLKLLTPITMSMSASESSEKAVRQVNAEEATFFVANQKMPVYLIARKSPPRPLVTVIDLVDHVSLARYWESLEKACTRTAGDNPVKRLTTQESIPANFDADNKFCRDCTAPLRWMRDQVMLPEQVNWLQREAGAEKGAVDIDDTTLARYSYILIASKQVITNQLRRQVQIAPPRRKRKSTQKTGLVPGPKAPSTVDRALARQVLAARKADHEQQRERDWEAIVRKYETRGGRKLDEQVGQTLRNWFMHPGSERIDTRTAESHLNRYFGFGEVDPAGTTERESAPKSTSSRTLHKRPSGTNATANAPIPKPKVTRMVQMGAETVSFSSAQRPPAVQRVRWNSESNELLRDTYAIADGRARHLDSSISWESVASAFPDRSVHQVRQHARLLMQRPHESGYLRALAAAWIEIWVRDTGTVALPDPNPESASKFDMLEHVAHLRRSIDKSILRGADHFAHVDEDIDLPADVSEIYARWNVNRDAQRSFKDEESIYVSYWAGGGATTKDRVGGIGLTSNTVSTAPVSRAGLLFTPTSDSVAFGCLVVKMVLSTTKLDQNDAHKASALFKAINAEEALAYLSNHQMCRRAGSHKNKRYEYSEKFKIMVDDPLLCNVHQFEDRLVDNSGTFTWPLVIEDFQMVALCQQFRRAQLDFEIDISLVSEALAEIRFNARKGDDETIENHLIVTSLTSSRDARLYLHPPIVFCAAPLTSPDGTHGLSIKGERAVCAEHLPANEGDILWSDCASCLSNALRKLQQSVDTMTAARIDLFMRTDAALAARSSGVDVSELQERCQSLAIEGPKLLVDALTSTNPPIFFWAGHDRARLISAAHLSDWTVCVVPKSEDVPRKTSRVFPRMWLDLYGDLVPKMWAVSARCVLKTLMDAPGLTEAALHAKLTPAFERLEVADIITQLLATGCICGKPYEGVPPEDCDRHWSDSIHYFVSSSFRW